MNTTIGVDNSLELVYNISTLEERGYTMRFVIKCKAKDLKAEIAKAWVKATK